MNDPALPSPEFARRRLAEAEAAILAVLARLSRADRLAVLDRIWRVIR